MPILRAANQPLLEGKEKTFLIAAPASAASTISVADIGQFSVGQYILIGNLGAEKSEVIRIHASTAPSGSTITLASNTVWAHSINDTVTQIDYNQVEFSRATTLTGSKSVLTTTGVEADDVWTAYNDTTNSTGFFFVRYKNSSTSVYSDYSSGLNYTGFERGSVRKLKEAALALTNEHISDLITDDFLLNELNNWQDDVVRQKDWDFELESATDTVVSGQKSYSFPTSPASFKYTDSARSILQLWVHSRTKLTYIDKRDYEDYMVDTVSTTLAENVATTDTDFDLTDAGDFTDAGDILVGDGSDDTISYTGKSTNTLTGVTGIATTHSSGATVWQTTSLGEPTRYTIYNDAIFLQPVASSTYHGETIHYDYWKAIPELDDDTDETIIPFFHTSQYYLAWKIEEKKGNTAQADRYRQIYESRIAGEMRKNLDKQSYGFKVWTSRFTGGSH